MTKILTSYNTQLIKPIVEIKYKPKGLVNKLLYRQEKKRNQLIEQDKLEDYLTNRYNKLSKIVKYFFKKNNNYSVKGGDNLKELEGKPFLIVANHQTALDPFYIAVAINRYSRWLSKYENSKGLFGILSNVISNGSSIYLSPDRKWTNKSKKEVERTFKKKGVIGIFPEGTRNREEGLGYFHKGAARIVLQHNVAYVPIAVVGNLSKKNKFAIKGDVEVRIGKPVYLNGLEENFENVKNITQDMRSKIEELLN